MKPAVVVTHRVLADPLLSPPLVVGSFLLAVGRPENQFKFKPKIYVTEQMSCHSILGLELPPIAKKLVILEHLIIYFN